MTSAPCRKAARTRFVELSTLRSPSSPKPATQSLLRSLGLCRKRHVRPCSSLTHSALSCSLRSASIKATSVALMYATLRIPQTTLNHSLRSPVRSGRLRLCSLRTQTGAGAKSGPPTHDSSPSLRPATALPSLCPQQPQRPPSPLPRYDGLLVRRRDIGQIGPHASVAWKIPNSLDFPPPA